jgi:hypothetical protein
MQRARRTSYHRAVILFAVAVMSGISARAQNRLISAVSVHVAPAFSNAFPVGPAPIYSGPGSGGLRSEPLSVSRPDAKTLRQSVDQATLRDARTTVLHQTLVSRIAGSCQKSATPFLEQIQLPLFSTWGGRLELAGFGNDAAMQNVIWGPSGGTATPVHDLSSRELSDVRPPSDNQSIGISLRVSLSRVPGGGTGNGLWKSLRAVANAGHTLALY